MNEDDWEVVFSASGMAQASIVQGRLETEGIPVQLNYESAGPIFAITINGLGEVKVMVPNHYAKAAREVLVESYADNNEDEDLS